MAENINRRLNIYINDKEVVNSLNGVTRGMTALRGQMRNLDKSTEDYDEQLEKLSKEYKELEGHQKKFREDIYGVKKGFDDTNKTVKDTTGELGLAREAFSNLFSGLSSGNLLQAKEGLLGIKAAIVGTAKAAIAFIATPLGATIAILAGIAIATKKWVEYNQEVAKATRIAEAITKLSGEALNQARIQAEAIEKIYGKPFEETLNTANVLVNEFGISFEEALNKIEKGLVSGGQYNDEYLQSIREYSTFFAQAGYSVEEFQGIIDAGFDLGIYSDKLPDALKEFSLSINEQTQATKDALNDAYGKEFTDKILKGVKDGSISAKEALRLMAEEAARVGLNAKTAQQLTADLFRGAGEDAGGALKIFKAVERSYELQTLALTPLQQSLNEVVESEKALIEAQDALLQSDGFELWKNDLITTFNQVKKGFFDVVYSITNYGKIEDKLKENAEKTAISNYTTDALKSFEEYIERRKISMGKEFDLEKVRLERLETINQQYKNSGAGSWDATEAEEEVQKRLEAEMEAVKKYIPKVIATNTEKTEAEIAADAKIRAAAAKKAYDERKKLLDEQAKEREALDKQLLATQRDFQDAQLDLMADGYDKEKIKINQDYDRKIEDLKAHLYKESELKEIQKQIDQAKASGKSNEVARLQALLNDKLTVNQAYNDTIIAAEQTRNLKLAQLQEKYLREEFLKQQTAHERALLNLQTRQNFELAGITSLEEAKAILQETLSAEELSKIKNLDQAKKALKEQYLKEEFELQKENFEKVIAQYQDLLALDISLGGSLFTDEERDAIINNLDQVANKFSTLLKNKDDEDTTGTREEGLKALSGIDILGFSPEQWDNVFNAIDGTSDKLQALQTVVGGLQNAFGMYFQFVDQAEQRSLKKFEQSINARKQEQEDLLNKGYISKELYNARIAKIDEELDKKKADIEYKQAKRQRAMQAVQIITNTAQAIMSIWAQFPKADFGITAGIMTGVVGALGAANLALVLGQPLPERGYKMGGFTGRGNSNEVDGVTHKNEYVIPANVLYDNDPVMPDIMNYIEGKRTGRAQSNNDSSSSNVSQNNSNTSSMELFLAKIIDRNSDLIEKQLKEGLMAWLEIDVPGAKKIREKIQELETIEKEIKK